MSKVTFRSKQPYFQLSYMDVFRDYIKTRVDNMFTEVDRG